MAVRMRRAETVERNRDAVLAAARRVFIEKGYAGATLEAIAEEAGFSKGVMYSQFESKADLFLALLDRRIDERAAQNERIATERPGVAGFRELLEVGGADALTEAPWVRVLIEFRALASRDAEINARYAAAHARSVEALASVLERFSVEARLTPRFPPPVMAAFILALVSGYTLETAANPAALPFEVVSQMVGNALGFPDREDTSAANARVPLRAEDGAE
jgi:AcrR family transcriptional regulator